ncbi:PH (Pleckstrin Homology) domain-containing protein [Actinocorallia herbida]|uniref:PH (Pleckstrin Homology) domain-containing protein n=1 Tax=Actinocorallia herbida TaxID=58109 RepID=A0A3N1DAH9_9ACTN|nr:PH domain-containing protein [Actinocorallia herbida]ROO90118.1 PH (Pleckstrin Homology) domain-containing protein [Actinocorallia herbida]
MKVFRSRTGWVLGWVWLVFAAVNFVDLALRGRDKASLIVTAVLLLTCGLAYVMGLRPAVRGDETGVSIENPFKTTRLPWSTVRKIGTGRALSFDHAGGHIDSWAVQVSARKAATAARASPEDLASRTPVTFAAEQLEELRNAAPAAPTAEPRPTWSIPALAAVLAPLALLVIAALV